MQTFTITWFSNNDATSGIPMTATYTAVDDQDARRQFNAEHPTAKVWSID